MKWLKQRLRIWVNNTEEEDNNIYAPIAIRSHDEPDTNCLRFKVFKANGGTVVQTDYYDQKTDRQHNTLHVIVEGQDLGQELGKIITYESLKI
jgi:hypothetical protein